MESVAPSWSLGGLRALVGLACEEAPNALAALLRQRRDARRCDLLLGGIARALGSAEWRRGFDGLLASLLADEAASLAPLSLYELATLYAATGSTLPVRARLALLWRLGRHPCFAARRVEERVARDLFYASSGNGPT
jgi:hypothetical protein